MGLAEGYVDIGYLLPELAEGIRDPVKWLACGLVGGGDEVSKFSIYAKQ